MEHPALSGKGKWESAVYTGKHLKSSHEKALGKAKLTPLTKNKESNILKLLGDKKYSQSYQKKLLK